MKKSDQYTGVNNPESCDCSVCGMLTILANNHGMAVCRSKVSQAAGTMALCGAMNLGLVTPLGMSFQALRSSEMFWAFSRCVEAI